MKLSLLDIHHYRIRASQLKRLFVRSHSTLDQPTDIRRNYLCMGNCHLRNLDLYSQQHRCRLGQVL